MQNNQIPIIELVLSKVEAQKQALPPLIKDLAKGTRFTWAGDEYERCEPRDDGAMAGVANVATYNLSTHRHFWFTETQRPHLISSLSPLSQPTISCLDDWTVFAFNSQLWLKTNGLYCNDDGATIIAVKLTCKNSKEFGLSMDCGQRLPDRVFGKIDWSSLE